MNTYKQWHPYDPDEEWRYTDDNKYQIITIRPGYKQLWVKRWAPIAIGDYIEEDPNFFTQVIPKKTFELRYRHRKD